MFVNEMIHYNYSSPLQTSSSSSFSSSAEIFIGMNRIKNGEKCGRMLKNLFDHAQYPSRLFIGLISEQPLTEKSCLEEYCKVSQNGCKFRNQVKSISISSYESKGKYFSRHLLSNLRKEEDFCLQSDVDVEAILNWDTALIETWMSIGNEYAILSSPLSPKTSSSSSVLHSCQVSFNSAGFPVNQLPREAVHLSRPLLAPLWTAAFSFGKCHADKKVPYDPNLPHLSDEVPFTHFAR